MNGTLVSFPGLGIEEFTLNRIAFSIGGIHIYWYGIIIALGFLCAVGYIFKRARSFGVDADRALDVVIGTVLGGVVGARIYYVIFSWDQYKDNLSDIFKIWEGGIAIYGAVLAGFLVAWLLCRLRKVKFLPMADVSVTGVILAQGIGRWGNFVNVEAFGSVTDLPWRMCSPRIADYLTNHGLIDGETADKILAGTLGVHPTFFYESVWCLIGFVLLVWFTKRRRFDGEVTLFYLAWYGAERAVVEGLRTDSLMWGDVRVSQALACLLFVASVVIWIVIRKKIKNADDPDYLKLYVDTAEGQAVLDGSFYAKPEESQENTQEAAPAQAEGSADAQTAAEDEGMPEGSAQESPSPESEKQEETIDIQQTSDTETTEGDGRDESKID